MTVLTVMEMKDGKRFFVEVVNDEIGECLKATLLDDFSEESRGVLVEINQEMSLEDNLLELYQFLDEMLQTPRGQAIFG